MVRKLLLLLIYFSLSSPVYASLRIGTVYFYPPFVMSNNTGFDIQFINKICQNLHETCNLIPMNYNELYSALKMGSIDLAIGGLVTYSAGPNNFIYSLPYVLSKGAFLTLKKNSFSSVDNLQGKVGIVKGSQDGDVFYDYLKSQYHGQFDIVQYDDMDALIAALSNGDISAAFTHESTVLYWNLNGGGQFKTLTKPTMVGQGIAIIALPKNAKIVGEINQQIKQIEQENFYLDLYATYFANEK